ncbi:MAG TPA: TlpA disulfide reductase family protein [Flavitalea sp.]|nr:TlpA disulfide reductase family protein [Flavitalea sp.]
MKTFLSLLLLISIVPVAKTQIVKKVSIDALDNYIKASERPLVVNFYATWCAPCLHELPYFQQTTAKYASQNVELVLVSMDYTRTAAKKIQDFAIKNNLKGTLFWLDETNADVFCPRIDQKWDGGIPATLFLNARTGYRKFVDRQLTEPQFEQEVNRLVSR